MKKAYQSVVSTVPAQPPREFNFQNDHNGMKIPQTSETEKIMHDTPFGYTRKTANNFQRPKTPPVRVCPSSLGSRAKFVQYYVQYEYYLNEAR